jgi:hypothetical protein
MLSMIANPVTALPVGYPRSGLSRSDLVLWPFSSFRRVAQIRSRLEVSGHGRKGREAAWVYSNSCQRGAGRRTCTRLATCTYDRELCSEIVRLRGGVCCPAGVYRHDRDVPLRTDRLQHFLFRGALKKTQAFY